MKNKDIALSYCSVCKLNRGIKGDQVDCGYYNDLHDLSFTVCAAQELTEEGWKQAAAGIAQRTAEMERNPINVVKDYTKPQILPERWK